ncbi:sugar ABC transporter ATP-binding protein [Herbiconiux sp. P15]|uniref:sugar ABC transporter ATP-binding protein n=1 Tax=Herbiconiux liukaitaii TaxID=3342799 RepID=UPI0035B7DD72
MTSSTAPYISASGLVRQFPGARALDGAGLDVHAGEIVGLLGKNGAGKSSLIKILAGLDRADEGEILIDGEPIRAGYNARDAHHKRLAFVHQELNNVPAMTVAENVTLGGRYPRTAGVLINRRRMRSEVKALLERLEIPVGVDDIVQELSGSQQRLVMIARALHHDARVLVLDEPTVSFTQFEVDHLHRILRELKADGHGIVYVSHRLAEVKSLTDRIVVMQDGVVSLQSATADVAERDMIAAITGESSAPVRAAASGTVVSKGDVPALRVTGLRAEGVKDASFDVHYGEVLGFAGLVGSGRSEMVRATFGADRREAGDIEIDGTPIRVSSPRDGIRHGIGLLPENRRHDGLIGSFSVRANITLTSLRRHAVPVLRIVPRRRENVAVRAVSSELAIKMGGPEALVGTLSGGNQQKVIIARWLEAGSRILIFDEPTQGVDVGAREEIFRVIREFAAAGNAVLMISSDFSELVAVCSRVLGVREGRITGEVEGADITESSLVALAYAPLPSSSHAVS